MPVLTMLGEWGDDHQDKLREVIMKKISL